MVVKQQEHKLVVQKLFEKNMFIEIIYQLLMEVVVQNLLVALIMVIHLHNKKINMLVVQHMKQQISIKHKEQISM